MPLNSNRLLIVDDALIIRQRIRDIAEEVGWDVIGEAQDGEQAVKAYRREQPDLVTMDIVMPRVDGLAALQQIFQEDPSAQVVMVTAVNQKEMLSKCIEAGAADFIVKPFEKASLHSLLHKYLRRMQE